MVFGASFTPKNRHVGDVRRTRRESVYKVSKMKAKDEKRPFDVIHIPITVPTASSV